jgi:hypothetical protein
MAGSEVLSIKALKAAAAAFRLGMEGQASQNLIQLIDFLAPLIQEPGFPNREEMNRLLGELFGAQSRKDYLHAADLLEYEVVKWITMNVA